MSDTLTESGKNSTGLRKHFEKLKKQIEENIWSKVEFIFLGRKVSFYCTGQG